MGFFFRKSFGFGPLRLTLSKSGLGASVGVKGFRYGIRPDGRAYINAGRYGIYYRKELGRLHANPRAQPTGPSQPDAIQPAAPSGPTTVFATIQAERLSGLEGTPLAAFLNRSYRLPRVDYLTAFLFGCPALAGFYVHPALGAIGVLVAIALFLWVARWERSRRSVFVEYALDSPGLHAYQGVVEGLNQLASCQRVWLIETSTRVTTLQDFKTHAGASALVQRRTVHVGAGAPPWLKANITVPAIVARGQTLYFLPDCVLVYDATGVAGIPYKDVSISCGTTRFTEDSPPDDAQIVDRVWLHPNVKGGPDRRYQDNREIPVCLYGEMQIASAGRVLMYLQTSRNGVPDRVRSSIGPLASGRFGQDCETLRPNIEVNSEHFDSLVTYARSTIAHLGENLVGGIGRFDNLLRAVSGEGNNIIHWFLRVLSVGAAFVAIVAVAYFTIYVLPH